MQFIKYILILLALSNHTWSFESLSKVNYFEGLNAPSQSIQQLPNKRLYQSNVITSPNAYNHYNRLYFNSYNYRMPSYPYIPYQGTGSRNPGYFQTKKPKKSEKPQTFSKPRIQHVDTKSDQSGKGVIKGSKVNPGMWMQIAGFTTQMPSVSKNDLVAYYATKKDETPIKIVDVVQKKIDDSTKIVVIYSKDAEKPFYTNDPPKVENKQGLLSIAIFPDTKQDVVFVDKSKLSALDRDTHDTEFLDTGHISEKAGTKTLQLQASSSKSINISLSKELDIVNKTADIDIDPDIFKDINFEREIVFITGRIFTTERAAKRNSSAKIVKIEDSTSSSKTSMNIYIEESAQGIEDSIQEVSDAGEKTDYWFKGHYVVSEKPKGQYESRFILDRKD
ncbi:MAG: hypothetical protein KC646_03215 [Candidatus Cloacimonetes bacterium]|nr:hypothetical protein [Candidatus Cloacimonadota bacterium]